MSVPVSSLPTTARRGRRAPAPLVAAAVLIGLQAAVGGFGAFYFGLVADHPQVTVGRVLFVAAFWAVALTGVAGVAAALTGRAAGRRLALGYVGFGILFTIAKLVFWHESDAVVFGVVDLVTLALLTRASTRAYVGRD